MSLPKFSHSLNMLLADGFDDSYEDEDGDVWIRCTQCDALAICGVPTHETGCPNIVCRCKGCGSTVPRYARYCEDCL